MTYPKTQSAVREKLSEASLIVIGIVGFCMAMVTPGFVSSLISTLGFSPRQATFVAAADLAGMTIGILLVAPLFKRVSRRLVAFLGLVLLVLGNMWSAGLTSYEPMAIARVFAGAGEGATIAAFVAAGAGTSKPTRLFGVFTAFNLGTAATIFALLPYILAVGGIRLLLLILAIFGVIGLIATTFFPSTPAAAKPNGASTDAKRSLLFSALAGLAGTFILFVAIGSIWPQMTGEGTARGLTLPEVSTLLSRATLVAIAGALLAAFLGSRVDRRVGSLGGALLLFFTIVSIATVKSGTAFPLLATAFISLWMFTAPFYMTQMGAVDPSGRVVALSMAAQFGGFSLGSIIAGTILVSGTFDTVAIIAAVLCGISIALMSVAEQLLSRGIDRETTISNHHPAN